MAQKKSKKKNPANTAYLNEQRWLKNKAKKLAKHRKNHPNDVQSASQIITNNYARKKPLGYYERVTIEWLEKRKSNRKFY